MLFSVVTVTRNNSKGLIATHKSLAAQTCRDFEWIVIDGASSDGTAAWLATTDAIWSSEPDRGIYDAMNKGIARARGDYLLFLNAGDRLAAPDTLAQIADRIAAAQQVPAFVYGDSRENQVNGQPVLKKARPHDRITQGMFTHHQSMLYRRDRLDNIRYDISYRIAADYKFTAEVLRKRKPVLYCPFSICLFEPNGVSQRRTGDGRGEQFRIRRECRLVPMHKNIMIYGAQSALIALRRVAPGLYWWSKNLWR